MVTKTKNTELINTRISKGEKREFEAAAESEGRKPAGLLRILIKQFLEVKRNERSGK